jgi:hypothetical protein
MNFNAESMTPLRLHVWADGEFRQRAQVYYDADGNYVMLRWAKRLRTLEEAYAPIGMELPLVTWARQHDVVRVYFSDSKGKLSTTPQALVEHGVLVVTGDRAQLYLPYEFWDRVDVIPPAPKWIPLAQRVDLE